MTETSPSIVFHGAARTVTGSCMEVAYGDSRILIDCGLFQGSRSLELLNLEPFAFDPTEIDAVVLTQGENVIRGQKLEMNLDTGQTVVDAGASGASGTQGGRVRSLFVPADNNGSEGGAQ